MIDGKRYWRIPVMDGEFLCEEKAGLMKSIGVGQNSNQLPADVVVRSLDLLDETAFDRLLGNGGMQQ